MTSRRFARATVALAMLAMAGVAPLWAQVQPDAREVTIDSIVVRGNDRYPASQVIRLAQVRVGQVVNGTDIQQAIRRMFATGNLADIRISVSPGTPAIFYIDVVERPIIYEFAFEGLEHVGDGTVRDTVGLFSGSALDPADVVATQTIIRKLLANEGFPQADVDTALAREPGGLDQFKLTFLVNEGPRLALARVTFRGNESIRSEDLRNAMATSEEGFFWFRPGELHREEYRTDLASRLPDFYGSKGFIDMQVLSDTVVVDTLTGKGRIEILIDEGPQYHLAELQIEGNTRFPSAEIASFFPTSRDGLLEPDVVAAKGLPVFDQTGFEDATRSIGDLYRDAGYLGAQVIPNIDRLPPDSARASHTVVVRWLMNEGQPAYVRQVDIVGNDYTHDRIIRQVLLTFPGDIYSQELLIQSLRNIQSLSFFETLPPDSAIQILPREDGDIDLVYRVREKQTGNINFGMSATPASGFAGFIGYDQPNLFGQGKNGHFRWLFGSRQTDIEITYSDPEILGSNKSLTIGLQSARDRLQNFQLAARRQTGAFAEVGMPLLGLRSTRFLVGYSIFRDDTDLDAFGVDPDNRGLINVGTRSTASLRVVRDTRAGGIFPTAGNRNSLSARFTGGPLGGDGEYGKYEFQSEWFLPVGQIGGGPGSVPIDLTFGLSFKGGLVVGDNPFFLERFFMGGTQVGIRLRGYDDATITPLGHRPENTPGFSRLDRVGEAFFSTTAQFGIKLTDNIYTNAFIDAGNVWARSVEFNPNDLLLGAGLGASLITPFGPVGLDYAYGFDRRDIFGRPDPGWKLHFRFGTVF